MSSIAIITARGGSKRIPRKNILPFLGRPIIAYSIEAALGAGVFDEVMVSTDDEEIAAISKEAGAQVPFLRSKKTANDYATTNDVLLEVLAEYEKQGQCFDTACCLYPTAPFVTGQKLKEAYELLAAPENKADTLISVVAFSYPPQRAYIRRGDYLAFAHPEFALARSQDLEVQYHDAGQFYLFKTRPFQERGSLFGGNILPYELNETEVQDIDTMTDFRLAELKYRVMQESTGKETQYGGN